MESNEIFEGKTYWLIRSGRKPFKVKVTGSPKTFNSLIRVMSLRSKTEWYERKHLLHTTNKTNTLNNGTE